MLQVDSKTHLLKKRVMQMIEQESEMTDEKIHKIIEDMLFDMSSEENHIPNTQKVKTAEYIFNSIRGLGILQPIIDDNEVTEIMVNGPDNIFVEKSGKIFKIASQFEDVETLENIIYSIASRANRTVNEANPIVDARLADGSRVNVVLKPVALKGPIMTIRKFGKQPLSMKKLIDMQSLSTLAEMFFKKLVESKHNIFICGGTGCGKTTFLNALSSFIPKEERIITIEDSAELQIHGIENLVSLETRLPNVEGTGAVGIRDLIKTSLRMRPERIIVGEVRGAEALDMLQAMNTGHDGSISTGHANSCQDMLTRLETMVLMAALIPLDAVRKQIASALDIIVHMSRMKDGSRKILEISEVMGVENAEIRLNNLFVYSEEKDCIVPTGNEPKNQIKFKLAGMGEVWISGLLHLQNEIA